MTGEPRVTLYTRADCHLCEEAGVVIAAVTSELGASGGRWTSTPTRRTGPSTATWCRWSWSTGSCTAYYRVEPDRLRQALLA